MPLRCGSFQQWPARLGLQRSGVRKAFSELVATIRKHAPKAKLIWTTTTPVRTTKDLAVFAENTQRVLARNKIAGRIISPQQIAVDDQYALVKDHPEYWSQDGVHLNGKGITVQAGQVARRILESLQ